MNKVMFIRQGQIVLGAVLLLGIAATGLYLKHTESKSASTMSAGVERTFHMVTGEYKTTLPDGKEMEAYRWDPGQIIVKKNEKVTLRILGVNGSSHKFIIEGTNISNEVKKGKETVVSFTMQKEGTYRIICTDHPDAAHSGPMIGYITVLP
ncbi:cupredoxin domain-containing protein [Paenibacillus chartarius]|uniref:Cupredoxin domain-containing protein n=1 Tax=Paenibacillus chartarius TaxID=747481 RepID=A0ABV6DI50_9BACL